MGVPRRVTGREARRPHPPEHGSPRLRFNSDYGSGKSSLAQAGLIPRIRGGALEKRASLLFVSIVARTAMIGLDALNNSSRAALQPNHPRTLTDFTARGS